MSAESMTAQAWICPRCYDDHNGRPCKPQDVLSAMRTRTERLVPGPWTWGVGTVEALDYDGQPVVLFERENGHITTRNDVAFVAHARTDLPTLLAAVEAVLAVIKEHRDLAVDYTPGFQDGMDQMAGDIEIAVTTALGVNS